MIREFHAPTSLEQAIALKARLGDAAVFLAGGTEVNLPSPFTPEYVISLERLPLADIRATETELTIGARCTIQQVIDSDDIPEPIKAAGRHLFNRNIRNVATVGGQLGSNRSYGSLLPILVALEAVVDLAGPNAMPPISALQYIAEKRKELITQVRIPRSALARRVAVDRYARTANDLALVTAAVALDREGEAIMRPIIAVGGIAPRVTRLEAVEQELHGQRLPAREALERLVAGHVTPTADLRGSAEYKRHVAGVLVAKTIVRAYRQGGGETP